MTCESEDILTEASLADVTLDDSFNGTGMLVADIGSAADYAQGVAVDSDGKIIVCGTSGGNMYTARYTAASVLDTIRRSSHLLDEFTIRSYEQPPAERLAPTLLPLPFIPPRRPSFVPPCLRAFVPLPPTGIGTAGTARTIPSFPC